VTLELLADLLFGATATVYLLASVLFTAFLLGKADSAVRWAPRLVALGVPLHAAQICLWSLVLHVCPVRGIHFALSVASMLVCLVYVLARLRLRIDVVGAFVAPQALAFLLASRFVGGPIDAEPQFRSALLPFHVIANLLGIALFTLASCVAARSVVKATAVRRSTDASASRSRGAWLAKYASSATIASMPDRCSFRGSSANSARQ